MLIYAGNLEIKIFCCATLISIIYLYWNSESQQTICILFDAGLDLFINFYVTTGSSISPKRFSDMDLS